MKRPDSAVDLKSETFLSFPIGVHWSSKLFLFLCGLVIQIRPFMEKDHLAGKFCKQIMKELHVLYLTPSGAPSWCPLRAFTTWKQDADRETFSLSGWYHHCDQPSGWELGRREVRRQNRHLPNLVCWGMWAASVHLIKLTRKMHVAQWFLRAISIWSEAYTELTTVSKKRCQMIISSSGKSKGQWAFLFCW